MNTYATCSVGDSEIPSGPGNTARFGHCMAALATVVFVTFASAATILVTLPEALEAVATPAFGAPWITAPAAPERRHDPAPQRACAAI